MRRILSAEWQYVNKIPINFIGIKQILLASSEKALSGRLFSFSGDLRAGLDPAASHGAGVEQERRRENERGESEGRPHAEEVAYGPDHRSGRGLAEGACLAAHRDHRRPHAGVESLVDPGQIDGLRDPADQGCEPERPERERKVT